MRDLCCKRLRGPLACLAIAGLILPAGPAAATVWNVSNVSQLTNAINNAVAGDQIVVAAGTYTISSELWMNRSGVTLRGATGNPDDVFLRGPGMNNSGYARIPLHINADDIVVQDLTSGECYWHAIQFSGGADRATIRNVNTLNAGEQHIKGSKFLVGGLIENVWMENTYLRINDGVDRPDDYLGGVDLHGAVNWVIRDTVAKNIIGQNRDGDAGIFLWNESANCITERCVIIGCNKGIAYGNPSISGTNWHMTGGIVRNNFVYNPSNNGGDLGIEMCFTKDVKVYNNTIYSDSGTFFRSFQIYASAAVPTVNLDLRYNIIRGNILATNANGTWSNVGNIVGSAPVANWFVDPTAGQLHLTKYAVAAIDNAALLADVPTDFDGNTRPMGSAPDVGADEFKFADVDYDGAVTVFDVIDVVIAFGSVPGSPNWNPACDLDRNSSIEIFDVIDVVTSFGT